MSQRQIAQRIWIWFNKEGNRWKLAKTDDGFWYCPIGPGGKRRGPWEPGFPPGLEDGPKWLKSS
jgi:hypothetical protein